MTKSIILTIFPTATQKTLTDFHVKSMFCLFLSLCRTVPQPYRLSHNQCSSPQSLLLTQGPIFAKQFWELAEISVFFIWQFGKNQTFFFFASFPWQSVQVSWVAQMGKKMKYIGSTYQLFETLSAVPFTDSESSKYWFS